MFGKRDPVKVTDQKALEPSVPPPNPSRLRRQVLVSNAVPTPQFWDGGRAQKFILMPASPVKLASRSWTECDPEWHLLTDGTSLTWCLVLGRVGLLLPWLYAAAAMSPRVGVVSW